MKKLAYFLFNAWIVVAFLLTGCTKEPSNNLLSTSERLNKYILEGVQVCYLWEAETDWNKYRKPNSYAQEDPYKLFSQLLYRDDFWSLLTDDMRSLESQFAGVSTTFGYTLSFYYNPFTNNNEVIAVVLYTSPHSPATNAGLKRGDIIIELNGSKLTTTNYRDLYVASSIQVRCGYMDVASKTIAPLPEVFDLSSVVMYENPINTYKIIEKEGNKIGYLCYTGFQQESEDELFQLFTEFKLAGVSDVVLDLRYNPGGYARTAQILSSILAPESAINNNSIYLEHYYNKWYTDYMKNNNYPLYDTFINSLPVCMNLNRLYVLTGKHTASASEATMVGLDPYMQVIQVGDTTSGKYCGGILLSPEDLYDDNSYYEAFSNWGMYIMIYRYANINGITSFSGGLVPDILVEEDVFNLKPFGDEDDPLLGSALASITGVQYVEKRAAKIAIPLTALPVKKMPVDGMLIRSTDGMPKVVRNKE